MLTIAIPIAISISCAGGAAPHWLQDLLASPMAKSVASRQIPKKPEVRQDTSNTAGGAASPAASQSGGFTVVNADPIYDPAFLADVETSNAARVKAGRLASQCKFEEAYQSMAAFLRERPDLSEFVDDQAADFANLTGRYAEAYALVLPLARREGTESPHHLLALSVASAGLGQVYAGQAEYCRDQAIDGLREQHIAEGLDDGLARRTDPQAVAIFSCLAMGFKYGDTTYLEMALRLDPTNVLAAGRLTWCYWFQGRTADIRRIASGMLSALPAGDPRRAEFSRELAQAQ
jgi:hypothetical protein